MGTNAISSSNTVSASQLQPAQPHFGPDVTLMNPQDIIDYVTKALGNIGDQLNDYKETVKKRQETAKELREIASFFRNLDTEQNISGIDPEQYCHIMTLLAKYKDSNPGAAAAYDKLLTSYGPYATEGSEAAKKLIAYTAASKQLTAKDAVDVAHQLESLKNVQAPKSDGLFNECLAKTDVLAQIDASAKNSTGYVAAKEGANGILEANDVKSVVKNMEEAQQSLNADNELVMMSLQQLMNYRNQITQFSSNSINTMNESMKTVIGNIR